MSLQELSSFLLHNTWAFFLAVLFFGGSIFVHELGHFLAARKRGVKVERFSIGFGPKIFAWRGKDGVEYRLSWLPLGGYVALPQLADMAAIEGESENKDPLPPVSYSTRVIVFAAGAFFNVLFAFSLATILWLIGQPTTEDQATTRIGYVSKTIEGRDKKTVQSPASAAGMLPGDVIRAIDGHKVKDWPDFMQTLITSTGTTEDGQRRIILTIERDRRNIDLTVFPILAGEDEVRRIGVQPAFTPIVSAVPETSLARQIGLQEGDRLLALNKQKIYGLTALYEALQNKDQAFELTIDRAGTERSLQIPADRTEAARLVLGASYRTQFGLTYVSPVDQITGHVIGTFRVLKSLLHPGSDVGISSLNGPVGIIRIFWVLALSDYPLRLIMWFAILININLAIFNLLPIPVLDGGHIAFATIGKLRGRPLPFNFIATAQSLFVVLLFSMILYVTVFGDIKRWVRDSRSSQTSESSQPAKP